MTLNSFTVEEGPLLKVYRLKRNNQIILILVEDQDPFLGPVTLVFDGNWRLISPPGFTQPEELDPLDKFAGLPPKIWEKLKTSKLPAGLVVRILLETCGLDEDEDPEPEN